MGDRATNESTRHSRVAFVIVETGTYLTSPFRQESPFGRPILPVLCLLSHVSTSVYSDVTVMAVLFERRRCSRVCGPWPRIGESCKSSGRIYFCIWLFLYSDNINYMYRHLKACLGQLSSKRSGVIEIDEFAVFQLLYLRKF